ncbi:MAG: hypothetical protein ABA06_03020 [Parcubacteria bacterium C7867-001]|nr:MAG: hypothetical protein ABA06_03020 [Parcubacteria bacterium C7867-001]
MDLRIITAGVVVLLIAFSASLFSLPPNTAIAPIETATSTLATTSNPTALPSSKQTVATTTPAKQATTTSAKPKLAPTAPLATPVAASLPAQTPTPAPSTNSLDKLDTTIGLLRGSLVNIICASNDKSLHSISGTGVVIDSRGLILTVAHVAQYLLLKDYPQDNGSSCVVRAGSPAENSYRADLVYISGPWVAANSKTLLQAEPTGTGENDFAILAITDATKGKTLPATYTSIPLSSEVPEIGEPVSIGSYGAEFLSSTQVRSALYPTIDFRSIVDRLTFVAETVDLIAVGGAAAQEGSSGGPVVNKENKLIGLITTSTSDTSVSNRTFYAITMGHIRRSFKADMGNDLSPYLSSHSPLELVQLFSSRAGKLSDTLIRAISR